MSLRLIEVNTKAQPQCVTLHALSSRAAAAGISQAFLCLPADPSKNRLHRVILVYMQMSCQVRQHHGFSVHYSYSMLRLSIGARINGIFTTVDVREGERDTKESNPGGRLTRAENNDLSSSRCLHGWLVFDLFFPAVDYFVDSPGGREEIGLPAEIR